MVQVQLVFRQESVLENEFTNENYEAYSKLST